MMRYIVLRLDDCGRTWRDFFYGIVVSGPGLYTAFMTLRHSAAAVRLLECQHHSGVTKSNMLATIIVQEVYSCWLGSSLLLAVMNIRLSLTRSGGTTAISSSSSGSAFSSYACASLNVRTRYIPMRYSIYNMTSSILRANPATRLLASLPARQWGVWFHSWYKDNYTSDLYMLITIYFGSISIIISYCIRPLLGTWKRRLSVSNTMLTNLPPAKPRRKN